MATFAELFAIGSTLETNTVLLLVMLSGITAFITAALGIGGGVLLLAVMATVLPVAALIPVHGLVQLGANGARSLMIWRHLDVSMFVYFSTGAAVGAIIGSFVVVQLPLVLVQVAVAGFILFLVWGRKPKARETKPAGRVVAGMFTTFISMFVGATGPLVAAFVHRNSYKKLQLAATFACCMSFQHGLKALVFTIVGFNFMAWLPLVLAMGVSSVIGTWLGLKAFARIPEAGFKTLFKWLVTLLACRLLWQAGVAALG